MLRVCSQGLKLAINPNLLLLPLFRFSDRLERYAAIKAKNDKAKQLKREHKQQEKHKSIQAFDNKQFTEWLKCEGCSALLQNDRLDKYGYIEKQAMLQAISHNQKIIEKQFERTDSTLKAIREVEEEFDIKILRDTPGPLLNLDNLQVLMRLEQKIEKSNKEQQIIVEERLKRKQLLCRRCFYLKHHNRLPDQHNNINFILDETDENQLLERIFSKKGDTFYMYLVDVFDVCGTLTPVVLERLFLSNMKFAILLTKYDMVNKRYFNYISMKPVIRNYIWGVLDRLKEEGKVNNNYKLDDNLMYVYFVSSNNKIGLNKLKKKLQELECKVQLIGYPNVGKTSLLNQLTSMKKPTSTVPGTSLSFQIGKFNKVKIFDCPGFYNRHSLVNLIKTPNDKSLLTWKQSHFAPGLLTNTVIFYGGMIEAEGVRIILFGNGGGRAIPKEEAAKWLLKNYGEFWKGLPPLNELNIKKYEIPVNFKNGVGPDIEIAGYGFIGLRLCKTGRRVPLQATNNISLYLPAAVEWRQRRSLVLDEEVHNRSAVRTAFRLQRLRQRR